MLSMRARKSVTIGLIFLVAVLFDTAIISAESSGDNNGAKTMEVTEPSCC
jgi:hypothetical protein